MLKKAFKSVVCVLLTAGLVCTGSSSGTAQAAKKATLKTKKVTMKVGEKKSIVIKNKNKKASYSFVSSSKAKVTVTKKGVIKAKKEGKVTVTVKEKYKTKTRKLGKVKVTVKGKDTVTPQPAASATAPQATTGTQQTATATPGGSDNQTPVPAATDTPTPTDEPGPAMEPISKYLEDDSSDVPAGFDKVDASVAGIVEDIEYPSTVITEGEVVMRKAKVVLPKDYTEDKKYPVVYLNHGIFGNETSLYGDNVQNVVWNAIANGDAEEMIAVFPNCCANETGNDNGLGFNAQHYAAYTNFLNDLNECLMPYINENYSTLTGRENTAICGFSMGGRVSLHIGFTLQDTFRYIGACCPAPGIFEHNDYGVHEDGLFTHDTFTLKDEYMNDTLVLIAEGNTDTVVGNSTNADKHFPYDYHLALEDNGVPHLFFTYQGGHDGSVYKKGMYNFFRRIFHRAEQ